MAEPQHNHEGLRARKKRELRARIVATAGRLFAEKGFAQTRVEEIAGVLDVSVATVFNYFGSKDALLLELAEEQIARFEGLVDRWVRALEQADDGIEELDRIASSIAMTFSEGPPINRRLYVEIMRVTLPLEAGSRISRRIHAVLESLLESGQKSGEVRTDIPADQLAERVADMLTGAFNNWLNDARHPLGERLERAIAFMREALRPVP
jgi:AcrR family transcriptional regulator